MSQAPITVTATCAVWLSSIYRPHELVSALERGNPIEVLNIVQLYGSTSKAEFSDCLRIGEADVTIRLMPQDDQVRLAVESLKGLLETERAESYKRQQAIQTQISKLQALTYEGEPA